MQMQVVSEQWNDEVEKDIFVRANSYTMRGTRINHKTEV